MKRRPLIKLAPGLMPGLLSGCSGGEVRAASRKEESILIIGAGVAGLAAAETLRKNGYERVTLLEARSRVGGRVWTSRVWEDAPLDLGASWIHGSKGNPITALAKEAGAKTLPTDYADLEFIRTDGQSSHRRKAPEFRKLEAEVYRLLVRQSPRQAGTLREVVNAAFSDRSTAERVRVDHLVHGICESDLAEDAEQLAAGAYACGSEFGGVDLLFPGGYGEVFQNRYHGLDVRMGHRVQKVTWNASGVVVTTNHGEIAADRLILTVPLGVLQKGTIDFQPSLPKSKRDAISALGMGCLNKLYLRFPKTFWKKDVQFFSYQAEPTGHWAQWLNMGFYNQRPVLLAFNSGSFAREIEGWSDDEIVEDAMRALRKMFGRDVPSPSAFQATRWASDPFTFGSYSSLRPGSGRSTIRVLGEPVRDRLFFAGEATHVNYPSTVHGAWLSGQREAERVMAV